MTLEFNKIAINAGNQTIMIGKRKDDFPTPTPSPTITPTITPSPTISPTLTPTPTPSATPSPGINFASTENGATLGNAVVNSGNVSDSYFGPSAYSTSMATGTSWTAIGALFTNNSNTNSFSRSVKSASSGSTFSGGGSSSSPFSIVVDLGQVRTFDHARYYQMFSDGKTTHAALDISSDGNLNTRTSGNWTQIHGFQLLDNDQNSLGIGVNFSAQTGRYLRIRIYNDGRYLNQAYTELFNFKLFYLNPTTPTPTPSSTVNPTPTATPGPTDGITFGG